MALTEGQVAERVRTSMREYSMTSERAQQQAEHRIGASEIGVCREYLRNMIAETPYDDDAEDDKIAAFVGSALGERLERAYANAYGGVLSEHEVEATLEFQEMAGTRTLVIPGHADTVDVEANCVIDYKAKDGLTAVKRAETDRGHRYQVGLYRLGLIQAGILQPGAQAFLVYVDRSGHDPIPHVVEIVCDDALYVEIAEWVGDAIYAHLNGERASRDRHYNWCEVACPFFASCRGGQTLAEGVIDDPEIIQAIKQYREGLALEKEGKKMKDEAKPIMGDVSGAIPSEGIAISRTFINPTHIDYERDGYWRMNIRTLK